MKSLSKLILFGAISSLLLLGGLFSVTPVLAETAQESGAQEIAREDLIDPSALNKGIIEDQGGDTLAISAESTGGEAIIVAAVEAPQDASAMESAQAAFLALAKNESVQVADAVGEDVLRASDPINEAAALQAFISSVSNGANRVTGIFVEEGFSFSVATQPSGSPGYISENYGEVTQFGMAASFGSKGFLAHNYLSGASFFEFSIGQEFTLVYGDGSTETYVVSELRSFEALQPNSPTSTFVDLDQGGKLSASKLFHSMYNSNNPVVLQTCIANNGISTWGRLFVIAVLVAN